MFIFSIRIFFNVWYYYYLYAVRLKYLKIRFMCREYMQKNKTKSRKALYVVRVLQCQIIFKLIEFDKKLHLIYVWCCTKHNMLLSNFVCIRIYTHQNK